MIICVVLPLFSILMFAAIFIENKCRRHYSDQQLDQMIKILEYNEKGYKLFSNNNDRDLFVDSLKYYILELDTLSYNDSVTSKIIGTDRAHSQRLTQAKGLLTAQYKRYSRLNRYADTSFVFSKEKPSNKIKLIEPDNVNLPYLNIAFRSYNNRDSINAAYLEFRSGDSIVYSQTYVPRSDINCFIIPNLFNDTTVLKLGYLKKDTNECSDYTFYCITYSPYE